MSCSFSHSIQDWVVAGIIAHCSWVPNGPLPTLKERFPVITIMINALSLGWMLFQLAIVVLGIALAVLLL